MHASPPNTRTDDIAFCVAMLPEVSRTFALAIELLPDTLREPVRIGYLLCRVVDTVEDDPRVPWSTRATLFDAFDRALADPSQAGAFVALAAAADLGVDAEARLARGAEAVFRRFAAQPAAVRTALGTPVATMSRGMRTYAHRNEREGGLRIRSLPDLERYCYFVAGTVGELLTALFLQTCPQLSASARKAVSEESVAFGLALQIVNIVKDCAEDQDRGICFLPEDIVARHGLSPHQLLDPAHREAALNVVAEVCAVAGDYLQRAMHYTAAWPADGGPGSAVRLFCLLPLLLAVETLTVVLEGEDTLVPGRSPKVGRDVVAEVLAAAREAATSDDALLALRLRYGFDPADGERARARRDAVA